MAILKREYELSVWDETLGEKGQKEEIKRAIIGAHDMDYLGRATSLKLSRKINGTNTLTFQLPSKYFDSELGKYVHNEFCDYLFNERKIKLKYDDEWFEFYVKSVSENKQFKSIMYQYSCEDAFIDELSRNGYGITFDTELYNNVEEIGIFTEQILEDSIWEYDASKNWGDFTEYSEEKLFKIPVSLFTNLKAHKLTYEVEGTLTNVYTREKRQLELGDDLARERKMFWDYAGENGQCHLNEQGIALLNHNTTQVPNDGYIYIPYSCLSFCYIKEKGGYSATEAPAIWPRKESNSYCLAPSSTDPTSLIQFIAIPQGENVLIDEAGLLVDKNYSYVMTLAEWNEAVNTNVYYDTENLTISQVKTNSLQNGVVYYEGYLDSIGGVEVLFGKKISITDRTEINISEEIDQYVTVYNNFQSEYTDLFTSDDWLSGRDYRICSYEATRTIVPQLARNLVQNGTEISDVSGWEVMKVPSGLEDISSKISVRIEETNNEEEGVIESTHGLIFDPNFSLKDDSEMETYEYRTFLNFGITGQEETIQKEQMYVLYIEGKWVEKENNDPVTYKDIMDYNKGIQILIANGDYDSNGDYTLSEEGRIIFSFNSTNLGTYVFLRPKENLTNPYFAVLVPRSNNEKIPKYFNLIKAKFFKAYTKGIDFFENGYYKYTGRDIFFDEASSDWNEGINCYYRAAHETEFIDELDIVEGDVYGYQRYFRQQLQYNGGAKDTFMLKSYLNNDVESNGLDPIRYTEDDYKIVTDYIDLNKCSYYEHTAPKRQKDCKHPDGNGVCMYQKYGYCPYLFQTQKHCRKIRTLNGEKSNRFNLTQELSKVFEVYPVYYIEHEENGKIVADKIEEDGKIYEKMRKKIFYITEKGMENKLGFRYEKNLSNISRTLDSKQIVTKLYVEDVDSDLSKTGLCSIKTAEDNPSKDSYIIDFSYYTMRGLLDEKKTNADLYGESEEDLGYLKQLGYYNGKYDELSNKIINLQDESFTELQANVEVNLTGIETAQQEMNKIKKAMSRYTQGKQKTTEENETYRSYKIKYNEQRDILIGLIEATFMTNGAYMALQEDESWISRGGTANDILKMLDNIGLKKFKMDYLDTFKYKKYGIMGQYTEEYLQIQEWKKERAKYLKKINEISLNFYQKYEPYLKEGTWSDSNYLSDNSYYFGAKEVAKEGAIPKVTYNISVIDLANLDEDYTFNIADTTYVEDIETFGINPKTGMPNRLKVIISGITYDLDIPTQNSIEIQNYTSQFEDLFQQVTASVQSLSFNENIYKRSSNFTATQNVSKDSLQGGLSENQLTLLQTDENNLQLDYTGQHGSDINNHNNKYKLDGQGLFFSNNGGQTWNVGVTPKGINADYINVGTLDASKIQIVDGNYLYFLWDKSGITAYRTPQATAVEKSYFTDFAKFNKYGLSLVEDGKIRLRAGYDYQASDSAEGLFSEEKDINENSKIGFYLYNTNGDVIFKTESETDYSARLSLAGEIYVTDTLKETKTYLGEYSYSKDPLTVVLETFYSAEMFSGYDYLYYKTEDNKFIPFKQYLLENFSSIDADGIVLTTENENLSEEITLYRFKKQNTLNKKIYVDNKYLQTNIAVFILFAEQNEGNDGGTESQEFELLLYDNLIYEIDSTNIANSKSILVKKNLNYPLTFSGALVAKTDESYYIENLINSETQTSEYNFIETVSVYRIKQNSNIYSLYDQYKSGETEIISTDGGVAIYINNQSINNTETQDDNDYNKRLICCAKKTQTGIENVFSILSNGGLYIGGEIEEKTGENSSLQNLDDYIKISTGDNTISLLNGEINIGGKSLVEGILTTLGSEIDSLRQEIQSAGLIAHSHDISGAESYPSKTGDLTIFEGESFNDASPSGAQLNVPNLYFKIASYKGTGTGGETTHGVISLSSLFNQIALKIKENTSTAEAGSTSGYVTGLSTGYIVDGD